MPPAIDSFFDGLSADSAARIAKTIPKTILSCMPPGSNEAACMSAVSDSLLKRAMKLESPREAFVQLVLELQSQGPPDSPGSIKKALLKSVQAEYDVFWGRTVARVLVPGAGAQEQPLITEDHKTEWLGFMEFLGLLFVNGLAAEKIVRSVLERFQSLRGCPDENLIEGVCVILLTSGVIAKLCSTERGKSSMSQWGRGQGWLSELAHNKKKYVELKSTFEDVFDLIDHNGQPSAKTKATSAAERVNAAVHIRIGNEEARGGGHNDGAGAVTAAEDVELGDFESVGHQKKKNAGKGSKGGDKPHLADASSKQVFVAGIGSASEEEVRALFHDVGEVEKVKILRTPEGDSKDVCFVTFPTEALAQKATRLNGNRFGGRTLAVRIASGGKGNEKGGAPHAPENSHADSAGGSRFDFLVSDNGREGREPKPKGKGGAKAADRNSHDPDPRQVFVAGIGNATEDEVKSFFEEVGPVDRVRVLRTPEGDSRDVCFVTFLSEDKAHKAIAMHGKSFNNGRPLTVRAAHGGKGADKGGGAHRDDHVLPDSPAGGESRFSGLSAGSQDRGAYGGRGRGKGGGGGRGKGKSEWLSDMDAVVEEALEGQDGPVRPSDFDLFAKRFLSELRVRDSADGGDRFARAFEMVLTYTSSKERDAVRKWSAYVFTLLTKFDPDLADELKKRDEERRNTGNAMVHQNGGKRSDDRWRDEKQ